MREDFIKKISTELIGMDGGNINSKLWLCGIEWGAWNLESAIVSSNPLPYYQWDSYSIPHVSSQWIEKMIEVSGEKYDITKYPFDRYVSKIILTSKYGELPKPIEYKSYMREKLYSKEGDVFKLNLFPISAKKQITWTKDHIEYTGCNNKTDYYDICREHRFSLLYKLSEKYRPKVILCIGRGNVNDFIKTFWGESTNKDNVNNFTSQNLKDSKLCVHFYKKANKPTLVSIPFFGRYLNSDDDMNIVGSYVSASLSE